MRALFTNDSDMGEAAEAGSFEERTKAEIAAYLNADPRHAAVVDTGDLQIAVFRGADDGPASFYTQALPIDEPDADGGDWTAAAALDDIA